MRVSTYASVNGRPAQVSPMLIAGLVSALFILIGGVFAVLGLYFAKADEKLESRCTVSVQAEVKSYKYSSDGLESPVYEYEYNGKTHSFSNNAYSDHPPYEVGDMAEIRINPDKPQEAFVPGDKTSGMVSKMFTIVGFSLIGVALIVVIVFWLAVRAADKQKKEEEPWEM